MCFKTNQKACYWLSNHARRFVGVLRGKSEIVLWNLAKWFRIWAFCKICFMLTMFAWTKIADFQWQKSTCFIHMKTLEDPILQFSAQTSSQECWDLVFVPSTEIMWWGHAFKPWRTWSNSERLKFIPDSKCASKQTKKHVIDSAIMPDVL